MVANHRLLGWRLSVTHKRAGLLFNFQMPMNCPSEEGIGCPGSGVIESCQLPCWVLEVFLWNTSKCFWLLNHLSSPPGKLWAFKIKICPASMRVSLYCFLEKHLGEWMASALLRDLPFPLLFCKSSSHSMDLSLSTVTSLSNVFFRSLQCLFLWI